MVDAELTPLQRAAAVVVELYQDDRLTPAAIYDLEVALYEQNISPVGENQSGDN